MTLILNLSTNSDVRGKNHENPKFDIVGTVYHLVIYVQSNKIQKIFVYLVGLHIY
jgi:hypothetical protein